MYAMSSAPCVALLPRMSLRQWGSEAWRTSPETSVVSSVTELVNDSNGRFPAE